MYMKRLP